ncbi:MAG: hypothetical protein O3C40_37125 [Planctomycetota bacterium]|nr:hypothetical protein [Planctomycetota bacterium]
MSIRQAVTPLRMIFWGGLLCVFDFSVSSTTSINGQVASGYRFDFLNDFVGTLLITLGVSQLSGFAIDSSFRSSMRFIFICSVLNCIEAFMGHFVFRSPVALDIMSNLLGLATLCATVMFCTSMNKLSSAFSLHQSADSWLTTRLLVIILWVIPLGLLYLLGLGALVTGQSFHWDIGVFIIPAFVVLIIPLVHLFVSTSRMRSEAELLERK